MKTYSIILVLVFGAATGFSQSARKCLSRSKVKQVVIYQVIPIREVDSGPNFESTHILGYKIIAKLQTDDTIKKSLLVEIKRKDNYVIGFNRSCEFLPKFAVLRGSRCVALISLGDCPKIKFVKFRKCKNCISADPIADLSKSNLLEPILSKVSPPEH